MHAHVHKHIHTNKTVEWIWIYAIHNKIIYVGVPGNPAQ